MSRSAQALTSFPTPSHDPALTGDLSAFALPDLLEFFRLTRASGLLSLMRDEERTALELSHGMIVGAGGLQLADSDGAGESALMRALARVVAWSSGRFSFERSEGLEPPPRHSIDPQASMMELMRLQDEAQRWNPVEVALAEVEDAPAPKKHRKRRKKRPAALI